MVLVVKTKTCYMSGVSLALFEKMDMLWVIKIPRGAKKCPILNTIAERRPTGIVDEYII